MVLNPFGKENVRRHFGDTVLEETAAYESLQVGLETVAMELVSVVHDRAVSFLKTKGAFSETAPGVYTYSMSIAYAIGVIAVDEIMARCLDRRATGKRTSAGCLLHVLANINQQEKKGEKKMEVESVIE